MPLLRLQNEDKIDTGEKSVILKLPIHFPSLPFGLLYLSFQRFNLGLEICLISFSISKARSFDDFKSTKGAQSSFLRQF